MALRPQDALTKTIPQWAAVVNRAVARHRRQHPQSGQGNAEGGAEWDTALHLPLWISGNERMQIEALLAGWTDDLMQVGFPPKMPLTA